MSLRAIWIVLPSKDAASPLYVKYFPTVEARSKSQLGGKYVPIPDPEDFVKLLLLQVGLVHGDCFVESRDGCDKPALYPAFHLEVEKGTLWPVVVLEGRGLMFCALPLEAVDINTCKSLVNMSSVSTALEVLHGLSLCTPVNGINLTPGSLALAEINKYISVSLPFGRPVCCDPVIASQLTIPASKSKIKAASFQQPLWNPVPHKGKSQVVFHVREEVRSMQFGQSEVKDSTEVYGVVTCKAEVEGVAPEVSIIMQQPPGQTLSISSTTGSVETKGTVTRIRFRPSDKQPLCCYIVHSICEPPIKGDLAVKVNENVAAVSLKLQLSSDMRNVFQQLQAVIPFPGLAILRVKPNASQGSITIRAKNEILWNIGSKFPSKPPEVSLDCTVRLQKATDQPSQPDLASSATMCAMLYFRTSDFTYSGTKIDPQTIMVTTAPKVRCSASSEFLSGTFTIWNSEGEIPVITNPPLEELQSCLSAPCE
ncbi:AP-5 complex subunit mu-1-like isoform X2 [Schistocerca serialis cubense]|uniref:AP-5 complex subunit mu-1-like isoform X2 n=1 Tax=Schistocerca serialis cubense TaxID=2023355 RepID=UPI00214DFF34|nr:AP-5 complex subunit mu-1-like isoform X2 [Schistocerca serialis cubense]